MPPYELLSLELRSPLAYRGSENPPSALGMDLPEGEEELFIFDEEDIIAFDPDDGPRLRSPLPSARFHGRAAQPAGAEGAALPDRSPERRLPAGRYHFLQWRPADATELAEGIEWFVREVWWERKGVAGPYFVRRVKEHGSLATQLLRSAE